MLEVGSGLGYFASRAAQHFSVVALDISLDALTYLRGQWGISALTCADAQALPYAEKLFHAIIAFDMIEHLGVPEKFLSEAFRVLRDDGIVILTTPNPDSLGARLKGRKGDSGCVWFGHLDESHINIRRITDWRDSFLSCGFEIVRDGTDFLWDTPYFGTIPALLQRVLFSGTQWIGTRLVGFLPWHLGENYVAILRRPKGH